MNVGAAMRLGVAVLWAPGRSHPAFGPTSFGPKSKGLLSARSDPVYIFPLFILNTARTTQTTNTDL